MNVQNGCQINLWLKEPATNCNCENVQINPTRANRLTGLQSAHLCKQKNLFMPPSNAQEALRRSTLPHFCFGFRAITKTQSLFTSTWQLHCWLSSRCLLWFWIRTFCAILKSSDAAEKESHCQKFCLQPYKKSWTNALAGKVKCICTKELFWRTKRLCLWLLSTG